jgi:hypothetical protein
MVPRAVEMKKSPVLRRHDAVKSFEDLTTIDHGSVPAATSQGTQGKSMEPSNKEMLDSKVGVEPEEKTGDFTKKIYTPLELIDMRSRAWAPKTSVTVQGMPVPFKPGDTLPGQHATSEVTSDDTNHETVEMEATVTDQNFVEKEAITSEMNHDDNIKDEDMPKVGWTVDNADVNTLNDEVTEKKVISEETSNKGGKKPFPYATEMKQWLDRTTS